MTAQELIKYFGNETNAASGLNRSPRCIRNWVKAGTIPHWSQLAIETITKGKLKADKK